MKAQVFTTISADGTKSTYFESTDGKHIICHDLNEALNIASYLGFIANEIKDNTIYFEK